MFHCFRQFTYLIYVFNRNNQGSQQLNWLDEIFCIINFSKKVTINITTLAIILEMNTYKS